MAIRYSRNSPAPSRRIDRSSSGSSITATWPAARSRTTEPLGGGGAGGGGGGPGPGPVVPSPPHAGSASSSARMPSRVATSSGAAMPDRAPGAPIAGRPASESGVLTRRFVMIQAMNIVPPRGVSTPPLLPPDSLRCTWLAASADRRTEPAMPVDRRSPSSSQRVNPKCPQMFAPLQAGRGERTPRARLDKRARQTLLSLRLVLNYGESFSTIVHLA